MNYSKLFKQTNKQTRKQINKYTSKHKQRKETNRSWNFKVLKIILPYPIIEALNPLPCLWNNSKFTTTPEHYRNPGLYLERIAPYQALKPILSCRVVDSTHFGLIRWNFTHDAKSPSSEADEDSMFFINKQQQNAKLRKYHTVCCCEGDTEVMAGYNLMLTKYQQRLGKTLTTLQG